MLRRRPRQCGGGCLIGGVLSDGQGTTRSQAGLRVGCVGLGFQDRICDNETRTQVRISSRMVLPVKERGFLETWKNGKLCYSP